MSKRSILSRAGQQSLMQLPQNSIKNKQASQNQRHKDYLKSSISDNLLQQMDDDYNQIQGYESKYVDEDGNQIDQSEIASFKDKKKQNNQKGDNAKGNETVNKNSENSESNINENNQSSSNTNEVETEKSNGKRKTNQHVVKKDTNSKNSFIHQPIIQQNHVQEDDHSDSPIKQLSKQPSLASSKYSQHNSQNVFTANNDKLKPGTLLQHYKKSNPINNKYQYQLQNRSMLKTTNNKNKSYLTNSRGLKQQEFYKIDYMNSGQYKKGNTNSRVKGDAVSFLNNPKHDLSDIEDILSDIKSLNSKNSQYKFESSMNKASVKISLTNSKYKGMKNLAFKNSRSKFNSFNDTNDFGGKLDDLLTNYQFSDTTPIFSKFSTSEVNRHYEQEQDQEDQNEQTQFSQSLRFDNKTKIQIKKLQRQQRRKNNKHYQDVKNEIKYGQDEVVQLSRKLDSQNKQRSSIPLNLKDKSKEEQEKQKEINQNDISQSKLSQDKQINEHKEKTLNKSNQNNDQGQKEAIIDKETLNLARNIKLMQINWNQMPIIVGVYNNFYHQFKAFPTFSPQQSQNLRQIFQKIQKNKLKTYSLFEFQQSFTERFGVKQIGIKSQNVKQIKIQDSKKTKHFKLLGKKQFIQQWSEQYENQKKKKNISKQSELTEQEVEVLIQFDLKWYKTLINYVYEKDLEILLQGYEGKEQSQYQTAISTVKYLEVVEKLRLQNKKNSSIQIKNEAHSIIQTISVNKLKFLQNFFLSQNIPESSYLIGLIPQILCQNISDNEQNLIKQYLKQNFRGGIYFVGAQKKKNICILEINRNNNLTIQQISNEQQKQVWIDQRVVFKIDPPASSQKQQIIEPKIIQIHINLDRTSSQQDQLQIDQLKIMSKWHETDYQVEQEQNDESNISFCKRFKNVLPNHVL